jgi:hypothetical protein
MGCVGPNISKDCSTFILRIQLPRRLDEDNTVLPDVGNHSPSNTVSLPTRLESLTAISIQFGGDTFLCVGSTVSVLNLLDMPSKFHAVAMYVIVNI